MFSLALSTMWGIGRFKTLTDFVQAANDVGFTRFELNHGVNSAMLRELRLDGNTITSIHEPCPADLSVATLRERNWLISATDEENRRQGVAAIRRSIDLAHELGATAIIVHPGRVDIDTGLEKNLTELYRQGKARTPEYAETKERLTAARGTQAEANVDAVRRSLIELAEYARKRHIQLGLENRYHYHEIPLPDELDLLLSIGYEDVIGYWYDVGHSQTMDRLGLHPHEEWLKRFSARMIGVHLHDVVGIDDHRAAGSGEVDWGMVMPYLPPSVLRTCEFQNTNSAEEVRSGVGWLVKQGCIFEGH